MRPKKRERPLSQETVGQVRTIQSGRQAEDIQKEEEQRKRAAEAKERLASYAPTRPDVGNHSVNNSSEPNQSFQFSVTKHSILDCLRI
ncbi:MAG: hypothetical protein ACLTOX_01070 [Streptococcus thermophilus]